MTAPTFSQPTIALAVPGVSMVALPRAYAADVIVGDLDHAGTFSIGQGDLDALDASVGGTVAAYTQAILNCSSMAPADATAWTALGNTYAQVHKSIVEAETLWTYTWDPIAQGLRFGTLYDQLTAINQQLPTWQGKIKATCGAAPPLPVPVAPLTPAQQQEDWSSTIKWVAIAAVVVAGVYFLSPIAMTAIAFVPKPRHAAARAVRTSNFRYLPRQDFKADDYKFSPGKDHRWHVWRRGDYVGQIVENARGYDVSSMGGLGGSTLDDALNSFIGHKHMTVYSSA